MAARLGGGYPVHPMKQQTNVTSASDAHPTHEQISRRAEELWKKYNCPTDSDEKIWLEAEQQLQREQTGSNGASRRNGRTESASPMGRRL